MSDSDFIQPQPIPILPMPYSNGNGRHPPEPLSIEVLPDPATLRQADLHALRLYAVGKPWEHPLINPKLAALLNDKVDITTLLNALGPSISAAVFQLDPHHLPPLDLSVSDLCQMLRHQTDTSAARQIAMQIIPDAARLDSTDLLTLTEYMHEEMSFTLTFIRKWERAVKDRGHQLAIETQMDQAAKRQELLSEQRQAILTWPYSTLDGQMCYNTVSRRSGEILRYPIADFTAEIVATIQPEYGNPIHHVQGLTLTGKPFDLRIEADKFEDIKIMKSLFSAAIASDPRAGIAIGMAPHLPLAVHRLSAPEVPTIQLYRRTGWSHSQFIMPGRVLPNIQIDLVSDLPYEFAAEADLSQGLRALMHLVASVGRQNSLPALMTFFGAPLADKIGLRDERYVTLIKGRTGKFKTSWSQTAMCLYGKGFAAERSLVKWGDGATTNAIEALASCAHDLPFLVDNYKPNTGEGERGLVKLTHRMAEGGGRRRLDRNAALRPTTDVFSWLIITGEDAPQHDTATSARMLWVTFDEQPVHAAQDLAQAQAYSEHLCAVGQHWIEWLENPQNQAILDTWRQKFPSLRQYYLDRILKINPEAINGNPRRIAQNLAFNHLIWEVLCRCSYIAPYISFKEDYMKGLQSILLTMALATVQSNPGLIFIQALRELLATGRALLIDPDQPAPDPDALMGTSHSPTKPGIVGPETINAGDIARRIIGYVDSNGGAFIFPDAARMAVESLIGKDALAQTTNTALYKRFDELGYLISKDKDGTLICKKIGGRTRRVLHLAAAALEPSSNSVDSPSTTDTV